MKGEISQMIALTAYGNQHINSVFNKNIYPDNGAFKFCKKVDFVDESSNALPELFATPNEWFSDLKKRKVLYLQLVQQPANDPRIKDRMASAFVGGGGDWIIEERRKDLSDCWLARWKVGNSNDPEKRIWSVSYGRVAKDAKPMDILYERLDTLKKNLEAVLIRVASLAKKYEVEYFRDRFDKALSCINSDQPIDAFIIKDLVPNNLLDIDAERLLGAVQQAWVFGGMGSWNDLSFDGDKDEYEEVSESLFSLLNLAICSAVNSFVIKKFRISVTQ